MTRPAGDGVWRAEVIRRLDAIEVVQGVHGTALANLVLRMVAAEGRLDALEEPVDPPPPPPPPPPESAPWFGHMEGARGNATFDQMLADSIGVTRPVAAFARGYSGSSHPATFASSSVASAEADGIGAMLNVKLGWASLAAGGEDGKIAAFFQSWPAGVFGEVYVNHEPENDGPLPASLTNPSYVSWAAQNGPLWCAGVRRYLDIAAPIIRARGLDVRVGGCLMGFSFDSERWRDWQWWEGLNPANAGQAVLGIDHYGKHRSTPPNPHAADIMPQVVDEFLPIVRAAGIALSFPEFNLDKREYGGENVIGTDESQAAGLIEHAAAMTEIPEIRMVCVFHTPGGPASGQAQLNGVAIPVWADICMRGRRP